MTDYMNADELEDICDAVREFRQRIEELERQVAQLMEIFKPLPEKKPLEQLSF